MMQFFIWDSTVLNLIQMRETFNNNERLRSVLDHISDGIVALDLDWQIVYVNQRSEAILARENLTEKNIWKEFPESVGGTFYQAYHKAIKTQTSLVVEDYS